MCVRAYVCLCVCATLRAHSAILRMDSCGGRWCTYSADPSSKEAVAFMWNAARRFVHGSARPGDLNQSIMVCLPSSAVHAWRKGFERVRRSRLGSGGARCERAFGVGLQWVGIYWLISILACRSSERQRVRSPHPRAARAPSQSSAAHSPKRLQRRVLTADLEPSRPVCSWQRRLCLRVADLIGGRRSSHRFGASCIGACSAAWHRLAHTGVLCA